jgi:Fe2+ or Zn2+ uptake regulation protein
MKSVQEAIDQFRTQGLRITPQRRAIFKWLAVNQGHPTAEEVYQEVSVAMPDISRTTVYNTLRELVTLGALAEVEPISQDGSRFDTETVHHHHLFCLRCHKLLDVEQTFPGLTLPEKEKAGYEIIRSQVTFYGYCPDCQGNSQPGAE